MAHPVRKHSPSRQGKRRTHWKLRVQSGTTCAQCAQKIPSHRVCPHCGYYRGRKVITIREKTKKDERS